MLESGGSEQHALWYKEARTFGRIASERGTGCLLIEHNVGLVLSVCSDVVVLDGGKIIERGDRAVILNSTAVREAYLGAHAEAA